MALVFSEEFNGVVGSSPPAGWTQIAGVSTVGTTGYHGQGCDFSVQAVIRQAMSGQIVNGSIFFVTQANKSVNFTPFIGSQQVGTTTAYNPIFGVKVTADFQIGVVDGGGNLSAVGHTDSAYRGEETDWTFVQVDVALSTTTIGTSSAIKVVSTVRVNGEVTGTGTSSFASNLAAYFDAVDLNGAPSLGITTDSVYCYNTILTTPIVTPNQGTPKARVSQAAIEYAKLPSVPAARVTQAVIEWAQLPSIPNARVTQAVIELILGQVQGWRVYEG